MLKKKYDPNFASAYMQDYQMKEQDARRQIELARPMKQDMSIMQRGHLDIGKGSHEGDVTTSYNQQYKFQSPPKTFQGYNTQRQSNPSSSQVLQRIKEQQVQKEQMLRAEERKRLEAEIMREQGRLKEQE